MNDYFGFLGKTVVVTGASSGMGEAAAKMLIDLGAEVHACGSGKRSRITYGPAKEYYYDLSEKAALDQLIAALPKKIDALFVCQGISMGVNPDLKVMKVNFLSVKYLVEALTPRVVDNGSVTIISSSGGFGWEQTFFRSKEIIDCGSYEDTVAWFESHPEQIQGSYVVAKQAVNTYVKYKVFDPLFIARKIRINAICPGNTKTGLTDDFNRSSSPTGDPEEGQRNIERIFLDRWNGRWASPEEMGWPLVAIGSKIFSYMSGQVIYFDYGLTSSWLIDGLAASAAQ
ncbi:MAG: SDR family oxidoreductase [Oscillospiraceae bacterium]|nr:SDR family oxidoreductase [Oscillospiraceae bacterium]